MKISRKLIVGSFIFFAAISALGQLPDQLSARYLLDQAFFPFQEVPGAMTPYFSSLSIDGNPVSMGSSQVSQIFKDSTQAHIPEGTLILKSTDSSGREVWNYPIGTEVAHEINFNDINNTLFELRLVRKISATMWDFGTYSPSSSSTLQRNYYSGNASFSTTLQMNSGSSSFIELRRISLSSCKDCHFHESSATYQYPSLEETGPCGFAPNNYGVQSWINQYQSRYGHSPFGKQKAQKE